MLAMTVIRDGAWGLGCSPGDNRAFDPACVFLWVTRGVVHPKLFCELAHAQAWAARPSGSPRCSRTATGPLNLKERGRVLSKRLLSLVISHLGQLYPLTKGDTMVITRLLSSLPL